MKIRCFNCQAGFNLLEIVATLIVAAVLGSMIYAYFASSVTHSTIAITKLKRAFVLHAVMENITADYSALIESALTDPLIDPLPDLKAKIGSEDPNNTKNNYSSDPADSHQHYFVIKNRFIKFDPSGNETDIAAGDPENLLKVTIKNDGGTLTALFTSQ